MSIGQLPPRRASRATDDAKFVQYDQYIDTHIQNTRRAVKLVDWATALVALGTYVTAFLLVAAAAEHWLVPGGFSVAVRTVLFLSLTSAVGYFVYQRLWPLCRRAINPVYAAQAIEKSSPSLKNSLVNLLLFRQHRGQLSDAVYHTLEEQAAHGLTRVPVDAVVDRTTLIRVGYALLAVVAIAGLYKVVSPKDPLVAARRVLLPWSDQAPASRVTIDAVTPGSVTVARGEFLDVAADVRGLAESDAVTLRFTTDDGQSVDRPIDMRLSSDGLRYAARLPDEPPGSERVGVAQNLRYRIEAGDARSRDFNVTVVPAPSILVDRVEYKYPEYTGFADRQVDGLGDIRAIEGTRVTIHARANSAIRTAHVDFNADGQNDLNLAASGTGARAAFELALRDDRRTPVHASYVLRFTNDEGRPNRNPVKHPIEVEPDLSPEAAILLPQERALDVPLNDNVVIEVEARDPDFALAEVRLRGDVAGRAVIDERLLGGKHTGRFTARHSFTPREHELRAGDVVEYWVVANDNRTPAANSAESEHRWLRIVSPDPAHQPPPDQIAQNDRQQRPHEKQPGAQPPNDPGQQGAAQQDQQPGANNAQQPSESFSRDAQPGANDAQQPSESFSRDAQRSAKQDQEDQPSEDQGDNQSRGAENQPGQQAEPGQRDERNEQNPNGEQTGAGAAGGEGGQSASQPDGARPENNAASRSANGQPKPGGEAGESSSDASPVSSQGDNDAEAFERIRNHLDRNGQLSKNDASPDQDQSTGGTQPSDDNATENGQPKPNPQQNADNESGRDVQPGANNAKQPSESFSRDAQRSVEQGQGPGDKESGRQGDDKKVDPKDDESGSDQTSESASQQTGSDREPRDGEPAEQPGTNAEDRADGTGAETREGDRPADQQPREADDESQSPGGQQTGSKGPSGAGDQQQNRGAPESPPEMKPGEKREQTGSNGEQTDKPEPTTGARGKRESDSQGEEGGDKPGGGEEGGGQKAPRDGTGSAGQNQSADEGAGESSEQGAGTTSPNAGQDARADGRTGQTDSETTGRGSKQRDGGDEPNNPDAQFSRDAQRSANTDRTSANEQQNSDQNGGHASGEGGQAGTTAGEPSPATETAPPGDAANLEYARKQTDLVLEKLADQLKRQKVDKSLLDQLGWSAEDLQRFVERWQQRKDAAARTDAAGDAARRELDDALRSLGLRRGTLSQSAAKDDTQRDLRQGFRGPVPLEYQERLRAYNQGVSRARSDGE